MREARVYQGSSYRVQIKVFDFTDWKEYQRQRGWEGDDQPTTFHVAVLPLNRHKKTAFSSGLHLYHGESFQEAWALVRKWTGNSELEPPPPWRKYTE